MLRELLKDPVVGALAFNVANILLNKDTALNNNELVRTTMNYFGKRLIKNKGNSLQDLVELYCLAKNFKNVRQKEILKKTIQGYKEITAEIDVVYDVSEGFLFNRKNITKYIECKYRSNSSVELEDVSKFASVLELFGKNTEDGILITNSDFKDRAQGYAASKKIELIDGKQFEKMLKSVDLQMTVRYITNSTNHSFIDIGKYAFSRTLSLDDKLKLYNR